MARSDDDYPYEEDVKPRVSVLNMILCFLNVAAAGAFVYFLLQDMEKRQAWSHAVFLHDVAILGLPLEEEEKAGTLSREARPNVQLDKDQLADAFKGRKGSVRDTFQAVDEPMPVRILPSHLNDDNLKDIFGAELKPYVKTLDEEVKRVLDSVLQDVATAAREYADGAKTVEAKRKKLKEVLLPLSADVHQVPRLNEAIAKSKDVDKDLVEAAQRRMLVDMLEPIEMNRPGDFAKLYTLDSSAREKDKKKKQVTKTQELKAMSLEALEGLLKKRLENAWQDKYDGEIHEHEDWNQKPRDSIEKRQNIAYLLFAIAHVNKPDGTPLYARGPERVQVVVGLHEFALAAQSYTDALLELRQRMLGLIRGDREGNVVEIKGKIERTPGFVDRHTVLVQSIKELIGETKLAKSHIDDLQEQKKKAETNVKDRQKHLKDISAKIVEQRGNTANLVARLRQMQARLFEAQVELADAADINFRLEILLRRLETGAVGEDEP